MTTVKNTPDWAVKKSTWKDPWPGHDPNFKVKVKRLASLETKY